jgi:hypothetical protein
MSIQQSSSGNRAPRRMKVGVSIFIRRDQQSLWENGIFQNCVFLVQLLEALDVVGEVYLVMGGDGTAEDARRFLQETPAPLITMADALPVLDVMIEMSAQLDRTWAVAFRERGGKVVTMRVGNDYVIDIERMVFDKPHGFLVAGTPYDEVWTLPQYEKTCLPYFRGALRAPVRLMPHVWSSAVYDRASGGSAPGYQPVAPLGSASRPAPHWRVGIFEPNVCMVKTSTIPLLVCEATHRQAPDKICHIRAYNTFHLKTHPVFAGFAGSLDIVRHGIATFEGRFPTYQALGTDVNLVVAHHWENAQNYLYYEALHGGYPLVHNSDFLQGNGYRYDGFDCVAGGVALLHAMSVHDRNLNDYRCRADAFLATLHPEHPSNLSAHAQALLDLYAPV